MQVGGGRACRAPVSHTVLDLVNGQESYTGLGRRYDCGSRAGGSSVHFMIVIIYRGLRGQIRRHPGCDGSRDLPSLSVQGQGVCNR